MIKLTTDLISTAINFASDAHREQKDKSGLPYIAHPFRVAISVREYGHAYFITALLHDTVEDTEVCMESIREIFGEVVAEAVDSVTRRSPKTGHAEQKIYSNFIARCRANEIGRIVKIADIADNMRPERLHWLPSGPNALMDRYARALRFLQCEFPEGEVVSNES